MIEEELKWNKATQFSLHILFTDYMDWGFGDKCMDEFALWWDITSHTLPKNTHREMTRVCRCWLIGCEFAGYYYDSKYKQLLDSLEEDLAISRFYVRFTQNVIICVSYCAVFLTGLVGEFEKTIKLKLNNH